MKKQFLVFAGLVLFAAALFVLESHLCIANKDCSLNFAPAHPHYGPSIVLYVWSLARGTQTTYDVYTAQTPGELLDGLMNYKFNCTLPSACINGMMFFFPNESQQCFWMKDTPEPLEQAWFNANGVVTAVYNATPNDTTTVCHEGNAVLELYHNISEQVQVGDYLPPGGISAIRDQLVGKIP